MTARQCLKRREARQPDDWWRYHTMSQLGAALAGQRRYTEAEPLLIGGYEGLRARAGKSPWAGKYLAQAAAWKAKLRLAERPADPRSSGATGRGAARCPERPTGRRR